MAVAITHPKRAKLVAYLAEQQGVTPEHFLSVMRARAAYRRARMYRNRSRKRSLAKNPDAFKRKPRIGNIYSGEGDFHAMLRVVGMRPADFIRLTGIRQDLFFNWYGHPMHPWPVEFLRMYGYAKNMEEYLQRHGVDTEKFKPKLPRLLAPQGRYPRTAEQTPTIAAGVNYSPWKRS